ncbi:MAG: hypothetical protein ACR2PG_02425 [Hyphomicrobiaceae bacterium]
MFVDDSPLAQLLDMHRIEFKESGIAESTRREQLTGTKTLQRQPAARQSVCEHLKPVDQGNGRRKRFAHYFA